jgi:hypothetical protein
MLKQLARIKIPVFSGNKKEYPHWRASFMECVDASGATKQYKLLQLKNVLAKGPLDFVSSLGHGKGAYQAALNRLDRKFGGERRALALRMEELDSISPIKDQPTFQELDRLADALEFLLVNLGESDEIASNTLYQKAL